MFSLFLKVYLKLIFLSSQTLTVLCDRLIVPSGQKSLINNPEKAPEGAKRVELCIN